MPICIPENPHFHGNQSEIKVWRALKAQLPDSAYLLHGFRLTDDDGDHEIDIIVAWPGVGIVFVEIKGGAIHLLNGQMWQTTNSQQETNSIHPAEQARDNMYAVKNYVTKNWSRPNFQSLWMVAFPDADINFEQYPANLPRNRIVDSLEIAAIADAIKREAKAQGFQAHAGAEDCEAFVRVLQGVHNPRALWIEESLARELRIRTLTENQKQILDLLALQNNFLVLGPAGSGKTFLALEQTRRLCEQGKRVALLCYSQGLAQHLARESAKWSPAPRPVFVGTFHSLGYFWKIKSESERTDEWWNQGYASELIDFLRSTKGAERFDAIVVDEGQDFDELWWTAINLAYGQDVEHSQLFVFGDDDQTLAQRADLLNLPLSPIKLNKNLRSTRQVAETAGLLASDMPQNSEVDGPEVIFVQCAPEDAHDVADEMLEVVREQGWADQQIAVVTTNHRHQKQRELVESLGSVRDYWSTFWDDSVFYAHTTGFKGLERPVVIVAVDGWKEPNLARQTLYAAISRPRDLLVVCGDLDMIRSAGGQKIARDLEQHQL